VLLVLSFFIPKPFPIVFIYIILWVVMPSSASRPKPLEQSHSIS
jgi:phage shock protein C